MRRITRALVAAAAAAGTVMAGQTGTAEAATPRAPVVFVHGYLGSGAIWEPARSAFEKAGYDKSELFTFSYDFNVSNRTTAQGLADFVDKVKRDTGAKKVDIVNHSMGGMVTMWYIKQLGGTANVGRVASLAGAHHGTKVSNLCTIVSPSCKEMIPGSAFLTTLTVGDETPGPVAYRTWYSPCDEIINPFTSTVLDGAVNTFVLCEEHLAYLVDGSLLSQVAAFVKGA
ncbi:esterase/lipase family protein [Streptomyces albireticuli]|uniref:esterase/lipase family protein n=1 Tax=Streptomyces albireticuli TaxID=1940 RepID=UPI00368137C2